MSCNPFLKLSKEIETESTIFSVFSLCVCAFVCAHWLDSCFVLVYVYVPCLLGPAAFSSGEELKCRTACEILSNLQLNAKTFAAMHIKILKC